MRACIAFCCLFFVLSGHGVHGYATRQQMWSCLVLTARVQGGVGGGGGALRLTRCEDPRALKSGRSVVYRGGGGGVGRSGEKIT